MNKSKALGKAAVLLDEHRVLFGDDIANLTIEAVHRELARLESQKHTNQQRKLVSFLFLDVVSSTKTFERLDPEDVMAIMNGALRVFGTCVEKHGGYVARLMGDALLAFFGAPISHENDAERAVRAGLDILKAAQKEAERITGQFDVSSFQVRVGINTGYVALGEVGGAGMEYTAMGDAINVAKHVEAAAPPDGLLITQDTYRHVRGIFDVDEAEAMQFKGRKELSRTYVVKYAKPRGFHALKRTIEGVEIPMIGRDSQMEALQAVCRDAFENSHTDILTIVGDAGMGKSRLLAEFDYWIETQPGTVRYLASNATPQSKVIPYSLFHDLFLNFFDLHDTDHHDTIHEKFQTLVSPLLDEAKVQVMAHFLGFNFADSLHVQALQGDSHLLHDIGARALHEFFVYLTQYPIEENQATQPTVVFFDDIQWADPGSLELLTTLVEEKLHLPLLFVCMARPLLYREYPNWGLDMLRHTKLELGPLSKQDSQKLVREILRKVKKLPTALRDLIVNSAEGNPFYIEELIHMLIEEGVIIKGEENWWVETSRLSTLQIPPTLTGIVQARIDKLPPSEKAVLQRAAVIGQVFWAEALGELAHEDEINIGVPPETLNDLQTHEMIEVHAGSMFTATQEFVFKSAILREVAYESVLRRQRNRYHERVAEWLLKHTGDRPEEYVSLIAEHYFLSGNHEKAIPYLLASAELAYASGDTRVAIRDFEQVLKLLPADSNPVQRTEIGQKLGLAYLEVGDMRHAEQRLNAALEWCQQENLTDRSAELLVHLGNVAIKAGHYRKAYSYLTDALPLAATLDDKTTLAYGLMRRATLYKHDHLFADAIRTYSESLALFRDLNRPAAEARVLRKIGIAHTELGDYTSAYSCFTDSIAICKTIGDEWCHSNTLNSLGDWAFRQKDCAAAIAYYKEALSIADRIANHQLLAILDLNMGHVERYLDQKTVALDFYHEALHQAQLIGLRPVKLNALAGIAALKLADGEMEKGKQWLGMAMNHPASNLYVKVTAQSIADELKAYLGKSEVEAALATGHDLDLEAITREELAYRLELGPQRAK